MTDQELVRAGQLVTPSDQLTRIFQLQAIGVYKQEDLASTMGARQYKMFTDIVAFPITAGTINQKPENGNNSIGKPGDPAYTVHDKDAQAVALAFSHYRSDVSPGDVSPTLQSGSNNTGHAVAFAHTAGWNPQPGSVTPTLKANGSMPSVSSIQTGLRRLTPVECERLQGWPDDHTRCGADGKEASDAKRYSATGDGVTAPVAQWIGERIINAMGGYDA
jgi:DNA (cytosine-5)-methyltransferase 1